MAYALAAAPLRAEDFSYAHSATPAGLPYAQPAAPAGLSSLEWRVVELGRADGLDGARLPRVRGWLSTFLFGPGPGTRPLANTRLEALRRLAASAQDRYSRAAADATAAARAAGYSEFQIAAVVAAGRARTAEACA